MSTIADSSGLFDSHYTAMDDKQFHVKGRTLFFVVILFTVVLLVTVFMLYAGWICRYRPATSSDEALPSNKPRGLEAAVIRSLPIILYHSSSELVAECSICLGVFEDGDKVKTLPTCSHCYHSDCVDTWLRGQSSCPLCRTSLRSSSDHEDLKIVIELITS